MLRVIKRALISVSDKTNLDKICHKLKEYNVEIISTGGTYNYLKSLNLEVTNLAEITDFPEILEGRVKTLHPVIHGGILAKPDIDSHIEAIDKYNLAKIELAIVNLYPFEEKLKSNASYDEMVENIDIGGPTMIRAVAKNHKYNTIVTDQNDYEKLIEEIDNNNGQITQEFRTKMAFKAFSATAKYDVMISNWFSKELECDDNLLVAANKSQDLRYGENPHQNATIYKSNSDEQGILQAVQLQGKELSYNNINDADQALELIREFNEPSCAIIKHTNPCGAASADSILSAYEKAFDADSLSAFGGIVALNREINQELALKLKEIFYEVIIAPSITEEAKEILAKKKNLRVLILENLNQKYKTKNIKSICGGFLVQDSDATLIESFDIVSGDIDDKVKQDLEFAYKVCKHVKSNAIVVAKNKTTIGVGAGQMSRIDSVKNAINKPESLGKSSSILEGACLASDAFFPFRDSIDEISKHGITSIIQPGGSVKDNEVIEAAKEKNISMILTKTRHFKH